MLQTQTLGVWSLGGEFSLPPELPLGNANKVTTQMTFGVYQLACIFPELPKSSQWAWEPKALNLEVNLKTTRSQLPRVPIKCCECVFEHVQPPCLSTTLVGRASWYWDQINHLVASQYCSKKSSMGNREAAPNYSNSSSLLAILWISEDRGQLLWVFSPPNYLFPSLSNFSTG